MIAMGALKRGILVASLTLAAMVFGSVSNAFALSPWWHLVYSSRPSSLQPGRATDEVQELKVSATGGQLYLDREEGEVIAERLVQFDATSAELQSTLEEMYGAHNVEVTGGPGDETGGKPYSITFRGELADRRVAALHVFPLLLEGGSKEATVTEKTEGRDDGTIYLMAINVGDGPANGESVPIQLADTLPLGLKAVSIAGFSGSGNGRQHPNLKCSLAALTCDVSDPLLWPYVGLFDVEIGVVVEQGAMSGSLNKVTVTGGGAPSAAIERPVKIGDQPEFGVETYEMDAEEEGGAPDTQAGSHPFQLTTTVVLSQTGNAETRPVEATKDLHFKLPPGLIGNPTPFPQCSLSDFLGRTEFSTSANRCKPDTAIGVAMVGVKDKKVREFLPSGTLFNLEPATGEPARFGFIVKPAGVPVILDTALRTGDDYGVTVNVNNITQTDAFLDSVVTFWGVPGDPRHDSLRGNGCLERHEGEGATPLPCGPLGQHNPPPLLSMPTACDGPLHNSVEADSWSQKGVFRSFPSIPMGGMDGCNRLPFDPSIKVTPDGQAGSTPTGLTVDEHISQLSTLAPEGLAESAVKGLSVTLPEGVALNPAGADGLLACSMEQIALQSGEAPTCPEAAKIGTVKIKTPLLPNPLEGAAYLATQDANPFGSLVSMYIYAEDPVSGSRAKAAGEVLENPVTGQLTAHFEEDPVFANDPRFAGTEATQFLPELAFEDVELHFFGGDRAPLTTPARCGSYTTTGTFTPWSGNPTVESSSTFQIVSGPNGGACHDPLPFEPTLTAGTTSIQAGGFSPFSMTMSRQDGQQSLSAIQLHMPPGLLGTLSTVKLCGEAQADLGTCGPESEIGETVVSVGVGGDPYSVRGGKVYITGPYKGAPYGLSIVNPAKAGPFDLGKVVVRAKVEVDQQTAALTITTDDSGPYKIPTILDGIPLQIQHVSVLINRPNFTFNPTNCSPLEIGGALESAEGSSAQRTVPFQVTNCAVLAFKPKLTADTSGKTSRANGASLHVKLTYPAGPYDANIAKVKVELPKALPSRLTTLQKACTAAVFEANPANCPAASIIGHATATTPVIPVPLTGPAIFVSHGNESFPSLNIILQGYGATVHLVGTTFISKTGITSSTFKTVPDVPVGTFELTLPQGPYSALTANTNLCKTKLAMPTEFVGQNGALIKTTTKIQTTNCPKAKKVAHKKKTNSGRRRRVTGKHGHKKK